jgi:GDP-L-fucose synthase
MAPEAVYLSRTDGDLRDVGVAHRIFSELRPAKVLHLAALVGGVKDNADHNVAFFEDNVLINAAVLSAARQARVPKLIALLSSCAFPLFPERPTTESDLQSGVPYDGNAGYGLAKRMLDRHIHMVVAETGWGWSSLTPVTIYGPHDRFEAGSGHVVGSLIRRCWEAKTYGRPFAVWGSGRAVRQFAFVDDVARLLLHRLEEPCGPDTTIVAPDEGITIKSLAESVARALDYSGPILFDSSQPEGVLVKRLRSERFSSRFPNVGFTSLREGLNETVRWFLRLQEPAASACGREPSWCP